MFPALLSLHFGYAQKNNSARYQIDESRADKDIATDEDALSEGKKFEKLDSTYYVGYLFEGYFKYNHSADYQGYRNAIPVLEKARQLFEKNYNTLLKNLFTNISYLTDNYKRFQDYFLLCNALKECYDNIEMPDSVMSLLNHLENYHFKKDFFGIYYHRAWTYHRNRIYTSAKYSFLRNSIQENETMAFKSCYRGLALIHQNEKLINDWFGENQSLADELQIYHYLALLHCYNKNYDSSFHYYQILAEYGLISWNNYAGFQSEVGNFKNAQIFFDKELSVNYGGANILKEPYYYLPQLYIYAGRTKEAVKLCNQIIQQNGSRPGFGWYNIALARAYIYDAQLDSARIALNKAANFKELHIGTTLTESQYEFTINLLRINLYDRETDEIKFLNKGWWFSPTDLYKIYSLRLQKLLAEYNASISLALNPDRYRMVYDLFCSEATTSFDEAWYLMKDFSPKYFANKYHNYQLTDKRENIQRYFQLFEAKFNYENGNNKKAAIELGNILSNIKVDPDNEKLFLGRLYEAASRVYTGEENKYTRMFYNNLLLENYPQLIPFSGIKMNMKLQTTGFKDATVTSIISDLQNININWINNGEAPSLTLFFEKKGDRYQAAITVSSENNNPIVDNSKLVFSSSKNVAKEIALRIFGKGGSIMFNANDFER